MIRYLIINFIGEDRPGLIECLTDVVSRHGGNWEESRMALLGGHFSGIARVAVAPAAAGALADALRSLDVLAVSVRDPVGVAMPREVRAMTLDIIGPDRPGILHEVSDELFRHGVNVVEIETRVAAAAMSGVLSFSADARIEVPADADIGTLAAELDAIADRLGVEILLDEPQDR